MEYEHKFYNKLSTLENEEAVIRKCKELEEIDNQTNLLQKELDELKFLKLEKGIDVWQSLEHLEYKIELVRVVKARILGNSRKGI